ncbi:hypothetical protein IZU99_02500 [Oscillospiraceae bacterium CM]|nr:hypothetical protein IZU99_02500 [Oscillospiraceae bacterium CM]
MSAAHSAAGASPKNKAKAGAGDTAPVQAKGMERLRKIRIKWPHLVAVILIFAILIVGTILVISRASKVDTSHVILPSQVLQL